MKIRQEIPKDYKLIYNLIKEAFADAEKSDGNEHNLVSALRNSRAFIPELSLVAEYNGKIVGHIMFTKAEIGNSTQLALAPLSVLPQYQRQGIGKALIAQGHKIAKQLGYEYSIVLGSDKYYPQMGYIPTESYGIKPPFEVPSQNFMACKLKENAQSISGIIKYAKEFNIN